MIDGRTVQETDPNGRSAIEMADLWQFVRERLSESSTTMATQKAEI
jgi:hypothetical protein